MGASFMQVQPGTQPMGKGGASPYKSYDQATLNKALGEELKARPGTSMQDMIGFAGQQYGVSPMQVAAAYQSNKVPSVLSGQPTMGQPNQYATLSGFDTAGSMMRGGGGGKGKGGGVPFQAPTKFDVKFQQPGWASKPPAPQPQPQPQTDMV